MRYAVAKALRRGLKNLPTALSRFGTLTRTGQDVQQP